MSRSNLALKRLIKRNAKCEGTYGKNPKLLAAAAAAKADAEKAKADAEKAKADADKAKLDAEAKAKAEADELWASVLKAVAKKSKFALSYLRQGFLVQPFDADHRIGFPPGSEETMNLVDNEKNKQMLLEIFGALGVEMPRLRFVITPPPEGWMAPEWEDEEPTPTASTSPMNGGTGGGSKEASTPKQPERLDPGEFKDDPLIKEALRIFKGQIVDVRK